MQNDYNENAMTAEEQAVCAKRADANIAAAEQELADAGVDVFASTLDIFGEITDKTTFTGIDRGAQFYVVGDVDQTIYTKHADGGVTADGMEAMDNTAARVAFKDAVLKQL